MAYQFGQVLIIMVNSRKNAKRFDRDIDLVWYLVRYRTFEDFD